MRRELLVGITLLALSAAGCGEPYSQRAGVDDKFASIPKAESNKVVAQLFDLSGSYHEEMLGSSGRAYEAATFIREGYFDENEEGRLILAQLSGAGKESLLYDGDQRTFRHDLSSAGKLKTFLKSRADPRGSRIFDGIRETLEYLNGLHDANPKLKSACLAFTDMENNVGGADAEARLMTALREYAKKGGIFCIYWCSLAEMAKWSRNLPAAGFKPGRFIVSSKINAKPELIRFDE